MNPFHITIKNEKQTKSYIYISRFHYNKKSPYKCLKIDLNNLGDSSKNSDSFLNFNFSYRAKEMVWLLSNFQVFLASELSSYYLYNRHRGRNSRRSLSLPEGVFSGMFCKKQKLSPCFISQEKNTGLPSKWFWEDC